MADSTAPQASAADASHIAVSFQARVWPQSVVDSEMDEDDESEFSDDSNASDVLEDVWERQGKLFYHHESSYLDDGTRSRRWKLWQVNYDRCSPAELKHFVNSRGLYDPHPTGVTLKYFYIKALEMADREISFRFMDLPPEMRLLVYRDLLVSEISSSVDLTLGDVHPSILQTCKQVNAEATGALYDDNTFNASFGVDVRDHFVLHKTAVVHREYEVARCSHARFFRIPQAMDDYPDFFKRISRLEINLCYSIFVSHRDQMFQDSYWPLNHYVYGLASFLMDGHRLRTLHLRLDISSEMPDDGYRAILYPLLRLRNIPNVTISGHVPKKVERKLLEELVSVEPAFNTMRQWKLLVNEAVAQLKIHEAMHEEVECMCGECPMPGCIEELCFMLRSLDDAKMEGCFTSCLEENFIARLSELRKVLQKVNTTDLQELVTSLVERRRTLKAYEDVSDEGRLDEAAKIWRGNIFDNEAKYQPDHDWSDEYSDADEAETGTGDEEEKAGEDMRSSSSQPLTQPLPLSTDEMDDIIEDAIIATAAI